MLLTVVFISVILHVVVDGLFLYLLQMQDFNNQVDDVLEPPGNEVVLFGLRDISIVCYISLHRKHAKTLSKIFSKYIKLHMMIDYHKFLWHHITLLGL